MNVLQRFEAEARAAVSRHHYDHPYAPEDHMPSSLADAIHADIMRAVDAVVADAVHRYLSDPHNLLGALADVVDGHGVQMQAALPAPDANPAA